MATKTKTSTKNKIENTKFIPCDCKKCFHRMKNEMDYKNYYCNYYRFINPDRHECDKFYELKNFNSKEKKQIKAINKKILEKNKPYKRTSLELLSKTLGVKVTIDMIFCNNKQKIFGNGKLKIRPIDKDEAIISVVFKDKTVQRYKIIKT